MQATLVALIEKFADRRMSHAPVIRWGAPVPVFGDIAAASLATVGLNPSNREFVDERGRELDGKRRRFHSLRSLGLSRWSAVSGAHLRKIIDSCRLYFERNPYDGWFRRLDAVISGAASFYTESRQRACHLDLIPYATMCKWTMLDREQRAVLVNVAGDSLGQLVRGSNVTTLVLNGHAVVVHFERMAGIKLVAEKVPQWSLPRRGRDGVAGVSFVGSTREIAGVRLRREVLVLGYNHNIQSSFGVTREVIESIRSWIAMKSGRNRDASSDTETASRRQASSI
jgi:hypothetical protein